MWKKQPFSPLSSILGVLVGSCFLMGLGNCTKDKAIHGGEWLIPEEEVQDGGVGKDGIPSIDDPAFVDKSSVGAYLEDDDLVLGFRKGNTVKAYPHPILDHHEIVNDDVNGVAIAVTYCPLTGTGIGWDRVVDGDRTTFGVSGLLYNNNLIPYDRASESNWSQMKNQCVNGERIRSKSEQHHLVETTWSTWKAMYPDTKVLSTNTGHDRNYNVYPYGDYKSNDKLLYPVTNKDGRLPKKERVLGVVKDGMAKAFRFKDFEGDSVSLLNAQVGAKNLVVAGSKPKDFLLAFERSTGDSTLQFQAVQDSLPVIMESSNGTRWNVFGKAVSGPDAGAQLKRPISYMGYWFAWAAFYPEIEIH